MTLHVYPKVEQRSEEWFALRRGIVTGSVIDRLITAGTPDASTVACPVCDVETGPCFMVGRKTPTPMKGYHSDRTTAASDLPPVYTVADHDTSRALTAALVAERIANITEDLPMTSDMWRGVELEPVARDFYAQHHAPVTEVGFMVRDDWGFQIGYSPDGLVGDDGLIEIKAPRAKGHILAVLDDKVPAFNMAQLQAGLLVSGREWIDYIPFVGGLPVWHKRVLPDPAWHEAIVAAVAQFEKTAAEMVAAYIQATKGLPVAVLPDLEIAI